MNSSKPLNQNLLRLALQAGGSHYPDVNRSQLQRFAELMVLDALQFVESDSNKRLLKQHFGVK